MKIQTIRPPDGHREMFRYANGAWVPDDGQPDYAFGGKTTDGWPYAYYVRSQRDRSPDHPMEIAARSAMNFVCSRYGVANGRAI